MIIMKAIYLTLGSFLIVLASKGDQEMVLSEISNGHSQEHFWVLQLKPNFDQ